MTPIVTPGFGLAQRWGGPIEQNGPRDLICFAPGEMHWHGAAPTTAMTHIAIQEQLDGKTVDWMKRSVTNNMGQGLRLKEVRPKKSISDSALKWPARICVSMAEIMSMIHAILRFAGRVIE